jgi:hypothetical protein
MKAQFPAARKAAKGHSSGDIARPSKVRLRHFFCSLPQLFFFRAASSRVDTPATGSV